MDKRRNREITEADKRKIKKIIASNLETLLYCNHEPIGKVAWLAHQIVWEFSNKNQLEFSETGEWFNKLTDMRVQSKYEQSCQELQALGILDFVKTEILRGFVNSNRCRETFIKIYDSIKIPLNTKKVSILTICIVSIVKFKEYATLPKELCYEDRKYVKEVINFNSPSLDVSEETYENISMRIVKRKCEVKNWVQRFYLCEKERREDEEIEAGLLIGMRSN